MKKHMLFITAAALGISMITGCGKTAQVPDQQEDVYIEEDDHDQNEDPEEYQEDDSDEYQEEDTDDDKGEKSGAGASKLCFSSEDVNGNPVNTADIFAKNKITVVNMWASWCGPCVGELPELDNMNKELKEKGCGVVGFLMDGEDPSGLADAKDTLEDVGASYQNIICAESVGDEVGLEAYPTTFFVDSNGKILGNPIVGAQPDEYMRTVEKLLSDM